MSTSGTVAAAPDGSPLAARRREVRLSRERLGALAGVSPRTIYNLEHNLSSPQRATMLVLAAALAVEPFDLFPSMSEGPAGNGTSAKKREQTSRAPLY